MKIAIVIGTRPEIIKMSPVIKYFKEMGVSVDVIHSGQHYSDNMDRIFFENLDIEYPELHLAIDSRDACSQISEIIYKSGEVFKKNNYDVVLVQGDTNTVFGAAVAAQKSGIRVGHIEAGLRSYDKAMPEEINRLLTDQISDYCFCPTKVSRDNLLLENINPANIFVVGNTIVDALENTKKINSSRNITEILGTSKEYVVVTLHRPSNVDNPKSLESIIGTLNKIYEKYKYEVVFPIHPRTSKMIVKSGIEIGKIKLVDPMDYFNFLAVIQNAKIVLTDSGGIQEEACIMQKPCITLRENTERPETVSVGANILVGLDEARIMSAMEYWARKEVSWVNPFGNGETSQNIYKILLDDFNMIAKK